MKYNLSNIIEKEQAELKFNNAIVKGSIIELTNPRKKRSITQNAYLHVCISLFGIHFGYSLEEAKTLLKRECSFMIYDKNNVKFLKKTSLLNSKELTDFIDWLRNYSGKQGLYIPTSEQYLTDSHLIDREIEKNKKYL